MGKEQLRGPVFAKRIATRLLSLTQTDLHIVNQCPEVAFALSWDTTVPSNETFSGMEGLPQVPVDFVPDQFGCLIATHGAFAVECNADFQWIEDGSRLDGALVHLSSHLFQCYELIIVPDN